MSVINTQRQTLIPPRSPEVSARAPGSRPAESSKLPVPSDALQVADATRAIEAQNLSAALPGIDDAVGALAATQLAKSLMLANSGAALASQGRLSAQSVLNLLQE